MKGGRRMPRQICGWKLTEELEKSTNGLITIMTVMTVIAVMTSVKGTVLLKIGDVLIRR